MEDQPGQQDKQHHVQPADDLVHRADTFKPHDHLGADFNAHDGTDQHGQAQGVVHVAELAVPHGGNQGFTGHLRHVRADGEGHGETENVQTGCHHPGAAQTEEAADDADAQTENDQTGPENIHAGNGHQNIQPIHICLLSGLLFSQFAVFEVDADVRHDDVGEKAKDTTENRNDDHGQNSEEEVAFIIHLRPPVQKAVQFAGIGHDDHVGLFLGRQRQ